MSEQPLAFALLSELSHLGDDEFDAHLVKFDGWENTMALAAPTVYSLPSRIEFEANFRSLAVIDFPYNDVEWPIMSVRMLEVLREVGPFQHEAVALSMLDDTLRSSERRDEKGVARPGDEENRFIAVNRLEELDAIDWEASVCERHDKFPQYVSVITRLVVRTPGGGFPPVFRLAAYPSPVFVSSIARRALEVAGVTGVECVDVADFRG